MNSQRLLIIDAGVEMWGSEKALLATLPSLIEHHERCLLVVPKGAGLAEEARGLEMDVAEHDIAAFHQRSRFAKLRGMAKLIAETLRFRPHVIYVNQGGWCRLGHILAKLCGARLVVHIRLREDIPRVASMKATVRAPVDAIHISRTMQRLYEEQHPHHKRHFMAYDFFDSAAAESTNQQRNESGFICIGRIAPSKGIVQLVNEFDQFALDHAEARFTIVGASIQHPDYWHEVTAAIADSHRPDAITLPGYRSDIDALLQQNAVLVSNSDFESLGRTVLEGWRNRCICIADRNSGGAAEMISASQGGFLFDRTKKGDLARALQNATQLTADERKAMNRKGRDWMADNVSLESYLTALQDCLFPASTAAAAQD